jgi:hypothetical protein
MQSPTAFHFKTAVFKYVNDIETYISNDIGTMLTLFADDTSILITGKDIEDLIFNFNRFNGSIVILHWFDKKQIDYK